jgi:hypothetical protein
MTTIGFLDVHLIPFWTIALLASCFQCLAYRKGQQSGSRRLLGIASNSVSLGCLLTIFGFAQTAHDRGVISFPFQLFLMINAALAAGCAGWAGRLFATKASTG